MRLLCQEWQRSIEVRERLTESVAYSAPADHTIPGRQAGRGAYYLCQVK